MKALSARRLQILDYLAERADYYPPSIRQIGEAVGLRSSMTIHGHLMALEDLGLITHDVRLSRTTRLTDSGRRALAAG